MKAGVLISASFFVIGIILCLLQLWFTPWDEVLFRKIIITVGAGLLISVVLTFISKELAENRKLKNHQ